MTRLLVTKHFAAQPSEVFTVITDLRSAAEVVPGIERLEVLTDGPIGVGTRFRETRVFFKREATEEMVITGFEPPGGYTVGCESHGCSYLTSFRLAPDGEGTRVEVDFEARPISLFARLMTPLGKLMVGQMRKCIEGDLDALRTVAEGRG